eukprot:c17579_g1_i1 orf=103-480(+)
MGRCPNHKTGSQKGYSHKRARRAKFLVKGDDAIYGELQSLEGKESTLPGVDEDLPGLGKFYCLHCDRYFVSAAFRDEHFRTKRHKKRIKLMQGEAPHTQLDAELAAGMSMPDNGPRLRDGISMGL